MKRLTMFQVPLRLRSTTERQPLSEICDGSAGNWPPALLTRKSTRPNRSKAWSCRASTCVDLADVGRHHQALAAQGGRPRPPSPRGSRGCARPPPRRRRSGRRPAPCAAPMPVPAPVTSATRPANRSGGERVERAGRGVVAWARTLARSARSVGKDEPGCPADVLAPLAVLLGRACWPGCASPRRCRPWGWWPLAFVGHRPARPADRRPDLEAPLPPHVAGGRALAVPRLFWMWDLTTPGYVVAGALYAAYFARGRRAVPARAGPAGSPCPALFLLAEVARWTFPFGGVPLGTLAMSQAAAPLGQTARLAGVVPGRRCSWWSAASPSRPPGSATGRWPAASPSSLVALWGLALVRPEGHDVGPLRVALVQGGGPQHTRAADTDPREVFERHLEASEQIDPAGRPRAVARERGGRRRAAWTAAARTHELSDLARKLDTTLIVGVTEDINDHHFLNAAVVYNPDGSRGRPLRQGPIGCPSASTCRCGGSSRSWPATNAGLPDRDAVAGTGPAIVHTPVGTMGMVISWEVFFADRARDAIANGGEVLLNPTNGSSYWLTIVQSQQVASSRLRAIETGRWTLQAAPTGFSAIIDPDGESAAAHRHQRAAGPRSSTIQPPRGQTPGPPSSARGPCSPSRCRRSPRHGSHPGSLPAPRGAAGADLDGRHPDRRSRPHGRLADRRAEPVATARAVRVTATDSRKRRSWETSSRVPSKAARACSSCSMASMSRWLVGSSSTRQLTPSAMSVASSARLRSPGERSRPGRSTWSAPSPNLASSERDSLQGHAGALLERAPARGHRRRRRAPAAGPSRRPARPGPPSAGPRPGAPRPAGPAAAWSCRCRWGRGWPGGPARRPRGRSGRAGTRPVRRRRRRGGPRRHRCARPGPG